MAGGRKGVRLFGCERIYTSWNWRQTGWPHQAGYMQCIDMGALQGSISGFIHDDVRKGPYGGKNGAGSCAVGLRL